MSVPKSSYHLPSAYECPACNRHFQSFGDRQRHLVTDHFQYGDLSWMDRSAPNKPKQEIHPLKQ
jgi:hypothetical protein